MLFSVLPLLRLFLLLHLFHHPLPLLLTSSMVLAICKRWILAADLTTIYLHNGLVSKWKILGAPSVALAVLQRLCEQMGDIESPIHSLFIGQGPSSFCEELGDIESPIHIPSCILPTTPQWVSLARGGALLPWVPGDILDASVRVAAGDAKGWCMRETAEWLLASPGTSQHHQQYAHLLLSCDGSAPNGACHESELKAAWSVVVGAFETTADDFYQRDRGIVCLGAISDICSSMDHGVHEDNILAE